MRARLSRLFILLLLMIGMLLVCGAVWIGAVLALGIPQESSNLGPANPALDPLDRALLSAHLLANQEALDRPAGNPNAELEFEVLSGQTAGEIVDRLEAADIVHNGLLLRNFMRYLGIDREIDAGRFRLDGSMTPRQIAETLQTAPLLEGTLVVIEGWRMEQIAAQIPLSGFLFDPQEFLDLAHRAPQGYSFSDQLGQPPTLEGFLFPDTYRLAPEASADELLSAMLKNFETRVTLELRAGFAAQGLDLQQAVTLASIIEREAVVADERALIASVFLNRLAISMKLDADPTVQYALGRQLDGSWWKSPLTLTDLNFPSPYNTYVTSGLPPAPIANPGLASLQAVAQPASSPYYFFRAACDGSGRHVFAETFDQHLQNACP